MIRSIRGRVVLLVLAAQLLAVAGAVALTIGYVHRALWSSFDSDIQARMIGVLALVDESPTLLGGAIFDTDQASFPPGDLFYVEDSRGNPVAGSSSWINTPDHAQLGARRFWKFRRGSSSYRGKAMLKAAILDQENHQIPPIRVSIFYAMPADRTLAQIANATRIVILVGLISLLLSAGATWLAVGRGMRSLIEFAGRADRIEADGARFEQPVDVQSSELIPLARALRRLVDRIQAAFQRERRFLSDAAHELKTAVAIQKSTLQLLEQGTLRDQEYRDGIARALEDTARTERLVADMLLLSSIEQAERAENTTTPAPSASLNDTLQSAIDRLASIARMKSVSIEFQPVQNIRIGARESELAQLWVNLLENAIQHSPDGSRVAIAAEMNGGNMCRVRIQDFGSGIASHDIPHVFERFYRSDRSRSRLTGGFGLGLSIAKAVVEKNHGTIDLQSTPEAGTRVDVCFPAELSNR